MDEDKIMIMNNSMSDELLKQTKLIAYEQGVTDTLSQLREVYGEGLELTNLWREYMKEGAI
jgi:hypothetical protein